MLSEIRIYFEGNDSLRPGFDQFFSEIKLRAREMRCGIRSIATGGEPERDFRTAMRKHPSAWNILLRDSEVPYRSDLSRSLCEKQGWDPSHTDSIFWMVQMMEAWFHADKEALESYYGQHFHRNALRANPNVEEISKPDLMDGLNAATKDTPKHKYHKTRHAPALLERIDPAKVRKAAPNCDKLFATILGRLG